MSSSKLRVNLTYAQFKNRAPRYVEINFITSNNIKVIETFI